MARDRGVKIVINTDSHAASQLAAMRFGVANARRAWLEAENVLNTRGPEVFLKQLHHGHR
jgi:DNA polymerase (family 10)